MIDYVDENKYIINCACDCMARDEMKRLFLTEVLRKRWVRTLTARILQRFLRSARAAHPLFSWQRAPWRRCGGPCRRRRKTAPAQTRLFGFSQHVPLPAIVFRQIRAQKQRFILTLDKKISSAAQGYWCKTRQPNAAILYVWQVTITQYCANRPS